MITRALLIAGIGALLAGSTAAAQISSQMRAGIAGARSVPAYTETERADAAQVVLKLGARPVLGAPVSLTPNASYAPGGARLSFWKPSFVVGGPDGGEAGFNFWNVHNEGHVNVGFTSSSLRSYLLDCRLLTAGKVTYKVYGGANGTLRAQGELALRDNHFMLLVPVVGANDRISVELWPTPNTEVMGFLGCELADVG